MPDRDPGVGEVVGSVGWPQDKIGVGRTGCGLLKYRFTLSGPSQTSYQT